MPITEKGWALCFKITLLGGDFSLDYEIMKIKVAKIEHKTSQSDDYFTTKDMDASISCFGVLLDSKLSNSIRIKSF